MSTPPVPAPLAGLRPPVPALKPPMNPARIVGPPPVWACHPNRMHCNREHIRRTHREGHHLDQRRLDGHLFALCDECGCCYVGVFHSGPRMKPIAYCYQISREQYDWWQSDAGVDFELDEDQETLHLLHLLGYNPFYRPTNPRTGRPIQP